MFWSARHRRVLQEATRKDGPVPQWDATGEGPFLVVDTRDALATPDGLADWRQRTGWLCPVASARRMSARVYMVTGDHCASMPN
jgi:hypothetical protein